MRYDETASHKLYWAIIVGLIGVTLMIIATGCSSTDRVLVTDCHAVIDRPTFDCSKKVR